MNLHWQKPHLFDERDRAAAEDRLAKLALEHDDLVDVRISAQETAHHRHGDREVRIVCEARGHPIVASRTRPDLGLALNEALDVFERQVRRMRGRRVDARTERAARPPILGVIEAVRADRDHGFILTDDGERVYFHRNAVHSGLDFERLEEGQRVGLDVEQGEKGLQATAVVAPPPDAPVP